MLSSARALVIWLPLVLAMGAFQTARAQQRSSGAERDSVRALKSARAAQADFERIRRNHFPWTWGGGGGPCDERVGRFCLTHGDDDDDWVPPPEPEPVREARTELLETLDTVASLSPGDDWIAGQRVRYLVEADRLADAIQAAGSCRASRWWCSALAGYAYHARNDFPAADSAFRAALDEMDPEEKQRWSDVSLLFPEGAPREYRRAEGAARDSLERRFWWLADPLYMVAGNERRTEHFSRWVLDQLQDRAKSTEGLSWGGDLRELLLRYGWPVGWERVRPPLHRSGTQPALISHYANRSRQFAPPARFLSDPSTIRPGDWEIDAERARAEYLPGYAGAFEELEHTLALFRRGDSVVVMAGYQLPNDTVASPGRWEVAMVLASDERADPLVVRGVAESSGGGLRLMAPAAPALFSLEIQRTDTMGRAARARYWLPLTPLPPGGAAVSDLLLFRPTDPLPESLAAAAPEAHGSSTFRSGEQIGIFWEVYGLGANPDAFPVSITLRDTGRGWLRRLGESLGVVGSDDPVRLRWSEAPPPEPGVFARSAVLTLPELSPGRYTLELMVTLPGREPLLASREIRIEQ